MNTSFHDPQTFGALPTRGGVRFVAPSEGDLTLLIHDGQAAGRHRREDGAPGVFDLFVPGAAAGDRYRYVIGDGEARP
ncbi:MAG: hypothetical protein ABJC51_05245, partial [Acidobacteriota bacterium]